MTDEQFEDETIKAREAATALWHMNYQLVLALKGHQQLQQLTANRSSRQVLAYVERDMWLSLFEACIFHDSAEELLDA